VDVIVERLPRASRRLARLVHASERIKLIRTAMKVYAMAFFSAGIEASCRLPKAAV